MQLRGDLMPPRHLLGHSQRLWLRKVQAAAIGGAAAAAGMAAAEKAQTVCLKAVLLRVAKSALQSRTCRELRDVGEVPYASVGIKQRARIRYSTI